MEINKANEILLINEELIRIGIPLDHEHARYFADGYFFAQKLNNNTWCNCNREEEDGLDVNGVCPWCGLKDKI